MFRFITCISILFISMTAQATSISCQKHACMAVIDAGSTGSRLHVYSYDLEGNNPVHIDEIFSKKIQPGIASVDLNTASINQYLDTLFSETSDKAIPVYFYATAGMRLLSNEKQQIYYEKIRQWFEVNSQWPLLQAKTISGKEEGLYGWLAVNYGLGGLMADDIPLAGVMDTGGASVQVTFPITNTEAVDNDSRIELDLYGKHFKLFVHSFLGLGQNELDHQYLDAANCFSKNYQLPNGTPAHGDFSLCKQETSSLINTIHHVDTIVKPVLESNPVQAWYGIGAISYLVQTPPLKLTKNEFSTQDLATWADQEFCHQDWSSLNAQYPHNEYLYTSCLNASYFYALFTEGYGIKQDQAIHILPKEQNKDDWTLGVVLHH